MPINIFFQKEYISTHFMMPLSFYQNYKYGKHRKTYFRNLYKKILNTKPTNSRNMKKDSKP